MKLTVTEVDPGLKGDTAQGDDICFPNNPSLIFPQRRIHTKGANSLQMK